MSTRASGLTAAFVPLALTYLAVAINLTIANIALPAISTSLDADSADLAWIVNATPLASAVVILFAGAVADRTGRKLMLMAGIVVFLVSLPLCLVVTGPGQLIAVRALAGVGSALAMPAALAMVFDALPERSQSTGVGIMSATQALGSLIGPMLGGLVLLSFGWEAAFLVVVPFLVVALIMGAVLLPRSTSVPSGTSSPPLDLPASILMATAGAGILYAVVEGSSSRGASTAVWLTAGLVGLAAGIALIWWESRCSDPLIDLRIVRRRRFALPTAMIFVVNFVLGGVMFLSTQYTQQVLGFSAFQAGLFLLPAPVVWAVTATSASALARRFGGGRFLAAAFVLSALGLVLVGSGGGDPTIAVLLIGMGLIGCMGAGPALLTHMSVGSFPEDKRTVASSLNSLTLRFGLAFGVAGFAAVAGAVYAGRVSASAAALAPADADAVAGSLGGALAVAGRLGDDAGSTLLLAAREAFTAGFGTAMTIAAGMLIGCAAVVAVALPRPDDQSRSGSGRSAITGRPSGVRTRRFARE